MKKFPLYLLFVLVFLGWIVSCESEESKVDAVKDSESSISADEQSGPASEPSFSVPTVNHAHWETIFNLQQQIMRNPEGVELRKQLCQQAYFNQNQALTVIGVARRTHPETGQTIPMGYSKQAAFTDAGRWAAYLQRWLENDFQPDFGNISEAVDAHSEVVREEVIGDSLYMEVVFQYVGEGN